MKKLNKTRELLVSKYVENIDKAIQNNDLNYLPTRSNHNKYLSGYLLETENTEFELSPINQKLLESISKERDYTGIRWLTFDDLAKKKEYLEDGKGKGVPIEQWGLLDNQFKKYISLKEARRISKENNYTEQNFGERFTWKCKTRYVYNEQELKSFDERLDTLNDTYITKEQIASKSLLIFRNSIKNMIENAGIEVRNSSVQSYSSKNNTLYLREEEQDEFKQLSNKLKLLSSKVLIDQNNFYTGKSFGSSEKSFNSLRDELIVSGFLEDIGLKNEESIDIEMLSNWSESIQNNPDILFKAIHESSLAINQLKELGNVTELVDEFKNSNQEELEMNM